MPNSQIAAAAAALTLKKLTDVDKPDLVPVQLRTVIGQSQGGGASYGSYRGGVSGGAGLNTAENDAGGMAFITQLRCFSGPSNGYHVGIGFPFFGRALGIAFGRTAQSYGATAQIDGVPYEVHADQIRSNLALVTSLDQAHAIIATDLDDGPHWGEIYLSPDPVGAVVRELDVGAILVDRASGYTDPARFASHMPPVAITTTPTAIVQGPSGTGQGSRGLVEISIYNTSANANRIKLTNGIHVIPFDLQPADQPGDYDYRAWTPPLVLDSSWTIVDTQNSSNYVPVFAY